MSRDAAKQELLSLIEEGHEYVRYLQELGVEHWERELKGPPPIFHAAQNVSLQPAPLSASGPLQPIDQPEKEARRIASPESATRLRASTKATPAAAPTLFADIFQTGADQLPESNETFEQIWAEIGNCTRCPLCHDRTNVVHTEGNRKARLMFVGEAPGADEDLQARPFVGRAGQLLTKIIEAIGLKRQEVLIGNVNRCRPPGNRSPTQEEASMCKPFLIREIAVARPEVIVVLGNTAIRNLLDTREGVTRLRGQFQNYKGIKVMPTFHPAYLLRDPAKKRETWEDLKKVRDHLDSNQSNPAKEPT